MDGDGWRREISNGISGARKSGSTKAVKGPEQTNFERKTSMAEETPKKPNEKPQPDPNKAEIEPLSDEALEEVAGGDSSDNCCSCSDCSRSIA